MADATVFALTADGKLYLTGYYDQASTLIPSPFQQRTPRLMISDVASFDFLLDAGGFHPRTIMVVKTDGTVWGVGSNAVGQIGDGTTTSRNAFVRAIGVNNAKSVFVSKYAGNGLTGIIRTDGTVSFAGLNLEGVMGYTVATAQTNYTTFVTPAFPAQGTIIEGMIGRTCTLRTATGAIWNSGRSDFRGLAHAVNNWTNNNKFQQVPLPEPALAMRGRMGQGGGYEDGAMVLTANHGILVWGSPYIGYASPSDQAFIYSPKRMADIRVLNNGITISDPLGGKYDVVATITAITAGTINDVLDGTNNQYVTVSLTTNGTAGKLDTTGATLTGANLTATIQTSYVYQIATTGNTIKLIFKVNATDLIPVGGAIQTQNWVVNVGGQSFNLTSNRFNDAIADSLTTNQATYLNASIGTYIPITLAEYTTLQSISGASVNGDIDSPALYTTNQDWGDLGIGFSSISNSTNSAVTEVIPANNHVYAFSYKTGPVATNRTNYLALGPQGTTTAFSTVYNGITGVSNTVGEIKYFVIKGGVQVTVASDMAIYGGTFARRSASSAPLGTVTYYAGPVNASSTTINNLWTDTLFMQVLSTTTKQWL
jgi:hypothetical protein